MNYVNLIIYLYVLLDKVKVIKSSSFGIERIIYSKLNLNQLDSITLNIDINNYDAASVCFSDFIIIKSTDVKHFGN